MTREEAAEVLSTYDMSEDNEDKEFIEAVKMAIKALEQEPCEDAISRQAVLDKLKRLIEVERLQGTDDMGYGRERVSAYECMMAEIESECLYPSVCQTRPKGKWIKAGTGGDAYNMYYLYKCSNCGKLKEEPTSDFCPNCGADMRAESEGKK